MTARSSVVIRALAVGLIAGTIGVSGHVAGQGSARSAAAWTHPKTPWGEPDIQGIWPSGEFTGVPLERPTQFGERALLTEEEFKQRETQVQGRAGGYARAIEAGQYGRALQAGAAESGKAQRQASLIVEPSNGRLPELTPEGKARSAKLRSSWQDIAWDWVDDFDIWDRCITRGLPASMFPMQYNNGIEIFQSPGLVVINLEMIHEARIVPTDGRPRLGSSIKQWLGESRGHWEGNTLVVETTNFNGKGIATNIGTTGSPRANNIPESESLRLAERFTRVGPETLNYEVRVEDPVVFTRPWKVAFPLRLNNSYQYWEYACHEGNTAIPNYIHASRAERAAQPSGSQKP